MKGDGKGKNHVGKDKKEAQGKVKIGQEPWRFKLPKEGAPKSKTIDGRMVHFCMNHNGEKGQWVAHDPKDCRFNFLKFMPKPSTSGPSSLKPKVRFNTNTTFIEEEAGSDTE
jgi:hypothetical protein